jgi:hypothetical protein
MQGLSAEDLMTLAQACETAEKYIERALLDEEYMLDFPEEDAEKMDDFRHHCADLRMRLDAALTEAGQARPPDEHWVRRVIWWPNEQG